MLNRYDSLKQELAKLKKEIRLTDDKKSCQWMADRIHTINKTLKRYDAIKRLTSEKSRLQEELDGMDINLSMFESMDNHVAVKVKRKLYRVCKILAHDKNKLDNFNYLTYINLMVSSEIKKSYEKLKLTGDFANRVEQYNLGTINDEALVSELYKVSEANLKHQLEYERDELIDELFKGDSTIKALFRKITDTYIERRLNLDKEKYELYKRISMNMVRGHYELAEIKSRESLIIRDYHTFVDATKSVI